MIKFFRKIRHNLLSEGKTGKYLKYALGEIILVVIGILIALQINNWNELSKSNKSVNVQLNLLSQNISDDLKNLDELNEAIKAKIEASKILSEQFQQIKPYDEYTTSYIITNLFEQNFYGNSAGYDNLTRTGEFSILPQSLQNIITDYYRLLIRVKEREEISNTFIKKELEPHYFDTYSIYHRKEGNLNPILIEYYKDDKRESIPLDEEKINNDYKMAALNFARFYQIKTQEEFYEDAIRKGHVIKKLINDYLK